MRRTSSMIGRWGLRPAVTGSWMVQGGQPSSAILHWPTSVLAVACHPGSSWLLTGVRRTEGSHVRSSYLSQVLRHRGLETTNLSFY